MTDIDALIEQYLADGKGVELLNKLKSANQTKEAKPFIPNPGPQTEAYFSQADVLLYGGQAGGGKSALLIGLAVNEHNRTLIIRRQNVDVYGLVDNAKAILGSDEGFTSGPGGSRPSYKSPDGKRVIHFEGYGDVTDIGSKQGTPHDLIAIDEGAQLPEMAIRLLTGWNRPMPPYKGRCRVVIASNPPLDTTGDWMISYFGPWLDPNHHNPAMPGELRWYNTDEDGNDIEASGPDDFIEINGEPFYPKSRTFIPASVDDNPYIDSSYKSTLNTLPEPYRSALRDGNFMQARQDDEWQVIPTAWVRAAMDRWKTSKKPDLPMMAMGVDVAQGGADRTVISTRYGDWFDKLTTVAGSETPDGPSVAGLIIQHRRNAPAIAIDMGGGYGGSALDHLKSNGIEPVPYKGAVTTKAKTVDKTLGFTNRRSEAYWRMREALDPGQPGGSSIMLPDNPELLSDLTTPLFTVTARGIKVEPKEDMKKRIGRSPDMGDAVVMCNWVGKKQENVQGGWPAMSKNSRNSINVIVGYANRRRKQ